MKSKKHIIEFQDEMLLGWAGEYPKDAPSCEKSIHQAKNYFKDKKYKFALDCYMKLINWRRPLGLVGEGIFKILHIQKNYELARNIISFIRHDAKNEAAWDFMLAKSYLADGHFKQAGDACDKAIIIDKNNHDAKALRAEIFVANEEFDKAIALFEDYMQKVDKSINVLNQYASILKKSGHFDNALDVYQQAIRTDDNNISSMYNRGLLYMQCGNFTAAINDFDTILRKNKNFHMARNHIASILLQQGKWSLGYDNVCHTLRCDPKNIDALILSVWFHAAHGRHEAMWKAYEARRLKSFMIEKSKFYQLKSWNGDITENQNRILVWREQGIGDEIMFAGVMQQLLKQQPLLHIAYVCDQRLHHILQDILPRTFLINPKDREHIKKAIMSCHAQIPIGSLAYRAGLFQSWRYKPTKFIQQDDKKSQNLREKILNSYNDKKTIIGLNWRSDNSMIGHSRSITIDELSKILQMEEFVFVPLQYKMSEQELKLLKQYAHHNIYYDSTFDAFHNITDVCDYIGACDAIISVDNSTLHLAGAIGKKSYVLMPNHADWRWLISDKQIPASHEQKLTNIWYDNMEFFAKNGSNWNHAIERVMHKLKQHYID